jgi:hypothetical protein
MTLIREKRSDEPKKREDQPVLTFFAAFSTSFLTNIGWMMIFESAHSDRMRRTQITNTIMNRMRRAKPKSALR